MLNKAGSNGNIPVRLRDFLGAINGALRVPNQNSGVAHLTLGGMTVMRKVLNLLQDRSGATAIEYGLIAALISVVIITAVTAVGNNLSGTFNTVANKL
jgi:pilus assembly protein Flp/PilA